MKAFRAAYAEALRIEAATAGASMEQEEASLPAHDAACAAMEDALARLMALPVPDCPRFAAKLEIAFAHLVEPAAMEQAVAASLLADAGRLAAGRR